MRRDAYSGRFVAAGRGHRTASRMLLSVVAISVAIAAQLASTSPVSAATPATYYVDCSGGNDANGGLSPASPWRTLAKASNAPLVPGGKLLFKRSCTWNGTLFVRKSGTSASRITIGAYGTGDLPRIQNGVDQIAVHASFLIIENVQVRADPDALDAQCANSPMGVKRGIRLYSGASNNIVRFTLAKDLFGGIWIANGSNHNSIVHNVLLNNNMKKEDPTIPDTSGATGIAVQGDDNDIGYNEISGSNSCSRVYGHDGGAIDIFKGQRNRIHHNISRNNHNFSELGNARSVDTTYAYNLVTASIAQAHFLTTRGAKDTRWGPVYGTRLFNNTVYLSGTDSWGVNCALGCNASVLTLRDNIIWANGTVGWSDAPFAESNNIYWRAGGAPKVRFAISSTSVVANPGWRSLGADFHLTAGSRAIDSATNDSTSRGFTSDLSGVAVPQHLRVDRGAYEAP
jgi:hypothetical protein